MIERGVRMLVVAAISAGWLAAGAAPVHAADAPSNDLFANAIQLSNASLPYTPAAVDTSGANTEAGEPDAYCSGGSGYGTEHTVWYRYVSPVAGGVIVDTAGSDFDTKIAVYKGSAIDNLSTLRCVHHAAGFGVFDAFHADAGITYWIQVGGDPSDGLTSPYGSLHIVIKAQDPSNDFFADAVQLTNTGLPYGPVTIDTAKVTTEAGEPDAYCSGGSGYGTEHTVWYRYVSPVAGGVIVDTAGSDFDTKIAVYKGSAIDNLSTVACLHTAGVKGQKVIVTAAAGITYWIQVGGDPSDGSSKPYGHLRVSLTDTLAPTVTAPACKLVSGTVEAASGVRVTCTWKGTAKGSPIADYTVRLSTDGSAYSTLETTTGTTRTYTLGTGHTYRIRVQTRDTAGRLSGWAASALVSPAVYQQTSTKIVYRGTWTTASNASFYGGSARYAKASGARATFSFTGRSVAWVARRCPTCGKAKVYVNGGYLTTLDLYASTTTYRKTVWARTWTTSAPRSIRVVVLGTAGRPRVDLDAFLILK